MTKEARTLLHWLSKRALKGLETSIPYTCNYGPLDLTNAKIRVVLEELHRDGLITLGVEGAPIRVHFDRPAR